MESNEVSRVERKRGHNLLETGQLLRKGNYLSRSREGPRGQDITEKGDSKGGEEDREVA